jgi:uncharacterized membrane-anchored protein
MTRRLGVVLALCALAAVASADQAKPKKAAPSAKKEKAPEPPPADQAPADGSADGSAADVPLQLPPHIEGPQLVDLGHDTEINLPAGRYLFEHDVAKTIVEKDGGNGDSVLAIIIPKDLETQSWSVNIDYEDVGYVKDDDANDLDPNDLFNQYKAGTDQQNARRRTLGIPELFLDGWSEMPKYDKATHKLAWGLKGHSTEGQIINFFNRLLGRNGYLSVDLIDSPDKIEQSKVQAAAVLTAVHFKPGATYADHKSGDKDSGMGLKALVLGGAGIAVFKAAKAGVFIKLLLVFKKGIIVLVAGIAAFFKKIFGRGPKTPTELPPDGPPVG